ncbi:MAG: hypothetical protein ABIQ18_44225, partial [Umezawaea sp.]
MACLVLALTDDLDEAVTGWPPSRPTRRHRLNAMVSQTRVFRARLMVPAGRLAEAAADLDAARNALPPRCWHSDMRPLITMVQIRLCLESGLVGEAEELSVSLPDQELGYGHARMLILFVRSFVRSRSRSRSGVARLRRHWRWLRECGRR